MQKESQEIAGNLKEILGILGTKLVSLASGWLLSDALNIPMVSAQQAAS